MPLKLRLMTYLVPDQPLELFQMLQYYLEERLAIPTSLTVESRRSGPTPTLNPVQHGDADIMFISSTSFLEVSKWKDSGLELLPVAPVFGHPRCAGRSVCFSEIIISQSRKDLYKDLVDMKGSRFVCDKKDSIAGEIPMQAMLKTRGYNTNFFGHCDTSGSHRESIRMVLQGRADVAVVESTALELFLRENPDKRKELATVDSLGPLPANPIVINSKIPAEMKSKLVELLLAMPQCDGWGEKLARFNITSFKTIDASLYDLETALRARLENTNMAPAYY